MCITDEATRSGTVYQLGARATEPVVENALPSATAFKVVGPLCVDIHEVTAEAYQNCVQEGKCRPPRAGIGCTFGDRSRQRYPINCVTFQQAATFCTSVSKRLPTELEWESAARGLSGTSGDFATGDSVVPANRSRPYCLNRGPSERTCVVDGVPEEGGIALRGMSGNVQEWTSSTTCPEKKCKKLAIVRGGYWADFLYSEVSFARRYVRRPDDADERVGFRCVSEPSVFARP